MKTFWRTLILLMLAEYSTAHGQDLLVNVGHCPSSHKAYDVAVRGHYAFVAVNPLAVFDTSDPTNPVPAGELFSNAAVAGAIALSGDYAFLGCGTNGIWIINIANPLNPWTQRIVNTSNAVQDIAVAGNLVYSANDTDGLRIFDISDVTQPRSVGHASNSTNSGAFAVSLALAGQFAYVAAYVDGLRIYDISDPTQPNLVGQIGNGTNELTVGVTVSGKYAYVLRYPSGPEARELHVFDVSDPTAPKALGTASLEGELPRRLRISGNYAYIADNWHLLTYDVSNPAQPLRLATNTCSCGQAVGVAIAGSYAYVANYLDGLRVYFLGVPASPKLAITTKPGGLVTVAWPTPAPAFELQEGSEADFRSPTWLGITNQASVVDAANQISLPAQIGRRFYRLKYP